MRSGAPRNTVTAPPAAPGPAPSPPGSPAAKEIAPHLRFDENGMTLAAAGSGAPAGDAASQYSRSAVMVALLSSLACR